MVNGARGPRSCRCARACCDDLRREGPIREIADATTNDDGLARNLSRGVPFASPVFDGAHEADIVGMLERPASTSPGQVDPGRRPHRRAVRPPVTVGYIYMLKLHHLVDDKIHARSIGPYSLVTQQPLGGKASSAASASARWRCGRSKAYGAAYTLQEILTVKSDDVPAAPRSTRRSCAATTRGGGHPGIASTCWSRSCARSASTSS